MRQVAAQKRRLTARGITNPDDANSDECSGRSLLFHDHSSRILTLDCADHVFVLRGKLLRQSTGTDFICIQT